MHIFTASTTPMSTLCQTLSIRQFNTVKYSLYDQSDCNTHARTHCTLQRITFVHVFITVHGPLVVLWMSQLYILSCIGTWETGKSKYNNNNKKKKNPGITIINPTEFDGNFSEWLMPRWSIEHRIRPLAAVQLLQLGTLPQSC